MSSLRSLKVSDVFSRVLSTSGKFFCNCWDCCLCPIGGRTGFFGVMDIVLFFPSVISVIGLEKLLTLGLLGSGAILGSLFLNGEEVPWGDKKLVSLDWLIGSKFFARICLIKVENPYHNQKEKLVELVLEGH